MLLAAGLAAGVGVGLVTAGVCAVDEDQEPRPGLGRDCAQFLRGDIEGLPVMLPSRRDKLEGGAGVGLGDQNVAGTAIRRQRGGRGVAGETSTVFTKNVPESWARPISLARWREM